MLKEHSRRRLWAIGLVSTCARSKCNQRQWNEHFSHDIVGILLFGDSLVVPGNLIFLETGITLTDDSLDLSEFARLFLNTHLVCMWTVKAAKNESLD